MRRRIVTALLLTLHGLEVGCKPGEDMAASDRGQGTGSSSQWSIALTSSTSALTIQQGASDTLTLRLTRSGGFTGDVTFAMVGALPGYTTTFTNVATTNNVTTVLATVTAPSNSGLATIQMPFVAQSVTNSVMGATVVVNITITPKPGVFVIAPQTMTVPRGGSAPATINITRTQFTDPVPLSLSGAPAGMTATFNPNPLTGTTTASAMTLTADATVAEGTYNIGVRANSGLSSQATAPVAVTVTAPASLSLSVTPASVTVARGASGLVTINITRTNYAPSVGFSIQGWPPGVTPTPPTGTTTNSAPLTFNVGPGTVTGTYTIAVSTVGPGNPAAATTFTLVVTP